MIKEKFGPTLEEWDRRVCRAVEVHYESAKVLRTWHYWLGIPALILVVVMGTLRESADNSVYYVFSVTAAVLVGLQTFLNFLQRAEKHKEAAGDYGALRREIEHLATKTIATEDDLNKCVEQIKERLDILGKSTPEGLAKTWKEVRKKYDKEKYKSRIFG